MKISKTFILSIFLLSLVNVACNKQTVTPGCGDPPDPYFYLTITNTDGDTLIGNIFTNDTFLLYNEFTTNYIIPSQDGFLALRCPDLNIDQDYYLELDSINTDTLAFNYLIHKRECYTSYEISTIKYNGKLMGYSGHDNYFNLQRE